MTRPDAKTMRAMLIACEKHFDQLKTGGCTDDVAADRTWDAYTCALDAPEVHCFDPRDRLFESKLRSIKEKGF
jgi:hypothetical protein